VEALAWQSYLLEQLGYPYAALHSWQQVLNHHPDHPTARQHIARLSCQLGDYQLEHGDLRRALLIYRDGLELAPRDVRLRASLTRCYGLLGDLARAQEEAEHLLAEHPDDLEAYYWLIVTWLSLGEDEAAQNYLDRARALQPPPPVNFYIELGEWCAETGDRRWAIRLSEMAQQHPLIDAQGLLNLSRLFYAIGQSKQVVRCLEQAVALAPEMAEAHLLLGLHLLPQMEARQKAEAHLLRAERLARQEQNVAVMAQARRALSALQMGETR
jgi:tetratricopeptide (TPR) repeat protein